jgi:hypothetical protein
MLEGRRSDGLPDIPDAGPAPVLITDPVLMDSAVASGERAAL